MNLSLARINLYKKEVALLELDFFSLNTVCFYLNTFNSNLFPNA